MLFEANNAGFGSKILAREVSDKLNQKIRNIRRKRFRYILNRSFFITYKQKKMENGGQLIMNGYVCSIEKLFKNYGIGTNLIVEFFDLKKLFENVSEDNFLFQMLGSVNNAKDSLGCSCGSGGKGNIDPYLIALDRKDKKLKYLINFSEALEANKVSEKDLKDIFYYKNTKRISAYIKENKIKDPFFKEDLLFSIWMNVSSCPDYEIENAKEQYLSIRYQFKEDVKEMNLHVRFNLDDILRNPPPLLEDFYEKALNKMNQQGCKRCTREAIIRDIVNFELFFSRKIDYEDLETIFSINPSDSKTGFGTKHMKMVHDLKFINLS